MREIVPIISDLIGEYYSIEEFQALAAVYDVTVYVDGYPPKWLPAIKNLVVSISHGNNQTFLKALVESLIRNAEQGVGNTQWEAREAHQNAFYDLRKAEKILSENVLPDEISVEENRPFRAKSEARQFLSKADTSIFIVDPFVGLGTLDCLLDASVEARILAGTRPDHLEKDFERHLREFCAEGRQVTVRRHPKLHDRHIFSVIDAGY